MKLFGKIRELREINAAAARASRVVLAQANRHGAEAARAGALAQEKLVQATEQAERLTAADQRNHYSESLTQSFRGSPA